MNTSHADRNLLFGILALQMDFIDRDALVAAMNAWVLEKVEAAGPDAVGAGEDQGGRAEAARALVGKHLEQHGNDPEKSLAVTVRRRRT